MEGIYSNGELLSAESECAREQIREWQDERLTKRVKHVYDNVPSYDKMEKWAFARGYQVYG